MKGDEMQFRILQDEKEFIERAAEDAGLTLPQYLRFCFLLELAVQCELRDELTLMQEFLDRSELIFASKLA